MNRFKSWPVLLLMVVMAIGCATTPKAQNAGLADSLPGAPKWLINGCTAYWDNQDEKKLCGVGVGSDSSRVAAMKRVVANANARSEISRNLSVKVKSMLMDYQATIANELAFSAAATDEQYIVKTSEQIIEQSLSDIEPSETWSSKDGTLFVLVVLDVDRFKAKVTEMNMLSKSLRQAIVEWADKSFLDLNKELQKHPNIPPAPTTGKL